MRELSECTEIRAPIGAVWSVLADFGGVAKWAPYMRDSRLIGEQRAGVGTQRGMRHTWGFRFEEVVTEWKDGCGFSFDVHRAPFPMHNVSEVWLAEAENGFSVVVTRVRYSTRIGFAGRIFDWLLLRFVVRREMRAGLRGLKYYVERNTARTATAGLSG